MNAAPSCASLLALGLVRLRARRSSELSDADRRKLRYTLRPTDAVMQLQRIGEPHDEARSHPRAPGRAEDHADARPEETVARPVRQRAAAVQPALPREPPGLPDPGTGLWRAEAGDDPAAGAAGRGTGRRRPERSAASAPIATARSPARGCCASGRVSSRSSPSPPTASSGRGGPTSRSLPSPAPITGTRWNGWVFFGLKNHRRRT